MDLTRYPKGIGVRFRTSGGKILPLLEVGTHRAIFDIPSDDIDRLWEAPFWHLLELVDYLILSRVGDRVVSSKYGEGVIHKITTKIVPVFPICVAFESEPDAYLFYGFGESKADTLINLSLCEREGMDLSEREVPEPQPKRVTTALWLHGTHHPGCRPKLTWDILDGDPERNLTLKIQLTHNEDGSDPRLVCPECEKKDKINKALRSGMEYFGDQVKGYSDVCMEKDRIIEELRKLNRYKQEEFNCVMDYGVANDSRMMAEIAQKDKRIAELELENTALKRSACLHKKEGASGPTCTFRERLFAKHPTCPTCTGEIEGYVPPMPGCLAGLKDGQRLFLSHGGHRGWYRVAFTIYNATHRGRSWVVKESDSTIGEYVYPDGTGAGHNHRVWWHSPKEHLSISRGGE